MRTNEPKSEEERFFLQTGDGRFGAYDRGAERAFLIDSQSIAQSYGSEEPAAGAKGEFEVVLRVDLKVVPTPPFEDRSIPPIASLASERKSGEEAP